MFDYETPFAPYDCIEFGYDIDAYEITFPDTCINNDSIGRYKVKCYATDPKGLESDHYELYFDLTENFGITMLDNFETYTSYDLYEIHIPTTGSDFMITMSTFCTSPEYDVTYEVYINDELLDTTVRRRLASKPANSADFTYIDGPTGPVLTIQKDTEFRYRIYIVCDDLYHDPVTSKFTVEVDYAPDYADLKIVDRTTVFFKHDL